MKLSALSSFAHCCRVAFIASAISLPFAASAQTGTTPTVGSWINTEIRIKNNINAQYFDDSEIYVAFNSPVTQTTTVQTYGNNNFGESGLQYGVAWENAPLSDFATTDSNGNPIYAMQLNNFAGRIYVSLGAPITSEPVNSTPIPYVILEPFINGQLTAAGATVVCNADISYVDGVSFGSTLSVFDDSGNLILSQTINPINTQADILKQVEKIAPSGAIVTAGTGNNEQVVRIISASRGGADYHDWNALMDAVQANGPLNIASFTSPLNSDLTPFVLSNVLFGYAGGGESQPNQLPGFLSAQSYTGTATFDDTQVTMNMTGSVTGAFTITIPRSVLNEPTGVYGSNPAYTVTQGSTTYTTAGVINDLGGRIVGDLLAGMVFGWANSDITNITQHAADTGVELFGYTPSSQNIKDLPTGEYFYLASLAAAQGKITDWIGAGIASRTSDYDIYNYAIAQNSDAYGTAFGDRFQGIYNPDISWYLANPPANPRSTTTPPVNFELVGYVQLELLDLTPVKPSDLLSQGTRIARGLFQLGNFGLVDAQYYHNDDDRGWLSTPQLGLIGVRWFPGTKVLAMDIFGAPNVLYTTLDKFPVVYDYELDEFQTIDVSQSTPGEPVISN